MHGKTASTVSLLGILLMNLPATISSLQAPVLSHKNVVAREASNSRLVIIIHVCDVNSLKLCHQILLNGYHEP